MCPRAQSVRYPIVKVGTWRIDATAPYQRAISSANQEQTCYQIAALCGVVNPRPWQLQKEVCRKPSGAEPRQRHCGVKCDNCIQHLALILPGPRLGCADQIPATWSCHESPAFICTRTWRISDRVGSTWPRMRIHCCDHYIIDCQFAIRYIVSKHQHRILFRVFFFAAVSCRSHCLFIKTVRLCCWTHGAISGKIFCNQSHHCAKFSLYGLTEQFAPNYQTVIRIN